MLDSLVPKTVDVKVEDAFVTLTGTADWQYQRDEADFVASNIVGTLDVFDEIEIEHPTPDRGDVKESIKKAFKRNAALDANDLHVSTDNGSVTVKGTVNSWAEHDEAIDAAWAAPGVSSVHDDYSADGDAWRYVTHDRARSYAYRWSEDGLAGICDLEQRLCLAFAFWNGRDPILKERIFGLTGHEGNHGEDAKELWWYLDATPDSS